LFEEEHFVNEAVVYFPENICKKKLSNADHRKDCSLFHTIYLPKMYTENYFAIASGFSCDQSANYHNCEMKPHL
jgi:hypothetical protein